MQSQYILYIIMAMLVNTLRVGCWNVRGLSASILYLRNLLDNSDIFCISEHWLHNNRLNCLTEISNKFSTFGRASRKSTENNFGLKRGQGGVAMFWRNSLAGVSIIDEIVNDRICGLRVQDARGTTTVVLSVYMPAVGAKDDLASTLDDLSGILYNFDDDVVPIICGDFNGDMGRNGGPRGRGVASKQGKLVANFMCEHKMITANLLDLAIGPMHTYESHKGYSCIDYIMLPEFMEDAILTCKVLGEEALNTSDHFPICMSIRMNRLPCKIDINNKKQRIKWDKWDDFTMNSEYRIPLSRLLADLNDRIFVSPCEPNELDNFFDELIMILHKSAEVLPRCKFANHLKPYWDEELTILKKNKMKWFRIWKEKGRPREKDDPDRIRMSSSKNEFAKRLRKKFEEMHGWRDNVSRRVSSVENSCTENMRQMRIMSDDVIDEVREVKHRLDAMDDARAHGITQQRQAQPNARDPPGHSHSESRNIDFDTRGRSSKRNSRQPGSVEDPRRRTASFSGPIRQSSKQSRPKQVVRIVDPPCVVEPEAPKDQRTRTRQNARRESRKNENPIKDWLSAAKAHPNKPTTNETQPASVPETLKSPSWADECDSEVNELETSDDFSTPTPTRYDCGREGAHGRDVSADSDEVIDVYEIPPSGQTTTTSRPATCDEEADVMYALPPANPTRSRGGRREQKTKPSNQNNKQQGDIPKQKGNIANESKGNNAQYNIGKNVTSKNGAKPKGKNSSAKNGKSYAMVVSENPWTTVQSNSGKKRKFEKVSPKLMFPLKGTASTNVKDVYLQGLDVEDGQTHDDVIDSVRAYCNGNGVKPVFIRIIPVKYDCTRTGCRLTIKIEDFERVMMESFWPELISVREWTPRNRDRFDQNEGREGDDLSDEN